MRKVYSTDSILRASSRFQKFAESDADASSAGSEDYVLSPSDNFQKANSLSKENSLYKDFIRTCYGNLKSVSRNISELALEKGIKESGILKDISEAIRLCHPEENFIGLLATLKNMLKLFANIHDVMGKYGNNELVKETDNKLRVMSLSCSRIIDNLELMQDSVVSAMNSK